MDRVKISEVQPNVVMQDDGLVVLLEEYAQPPHEHADPTVIAVAETGPLIRTVSEPNLTLEILPMEELIAVHSYLRVGLPPAHEVNGNQVRFRNPDGTWGDYIELIGGGAVYTGTKIEYVRVFQAGDPEIGSSTFTVPPESEVVFDAPNEIDVFVYGMYQDNAGVPGSQQVTIGTSIVAGMVVVVRNLLASGAGGVPEVYVDGAPARLDFTQVPSRPGLYDMDVTVL